MNDKPIIDYKNLPHMPRCGIKFSTNNHFHTRALFLETSIDDTLRKDALWTLEESEVYAYGKWYPSAWMAYIYATDEYDALRKICGNVRQWEQVKEMFVRMRRGDMLEAWQAEQAYMQRMELRATLTKGALSGEAGYTAAARMLLGMIDKPPTRGRPKKVKEEAKVDSGLEDDVSRVIQFRK